MATRAYSGKYGLGLGLGLGLGKGVITSVPVGG